MEKLFKKFSLEVLDVKMAADQKGVFRAFLNKYNLVDLGGDRTLPSFGARNNGKVIPLLKQHEVGTEHGILKIKDDKDGIMIEGELFLEKNEGSDVPTFPLAHETYALLKRGKAGGIPVEFSMGYYLYDFEVVIENGQTIRNLIDGEIIEGSRVTFAMNPESIQLDVKELEGGEPVKQKAGFVETLQGREAKRQMWTLLDTFTDSVFETIKDSALGKDERKTVVNKSVDDFSRLFKGAVNGVIDSLPEGKEISEAEKKVRDIFDKKRTGENEGQRALSELYISFKGGQ